MSPRSIFEMSDKGRDLYERVLEFVAANIVPNEDLYEQQVAEGDRWAVVPIMEELKARARSAGLWNLFLPDSEHGAGLSNLEYAPIAEITGSMEVLVRYASNELQERWLTPLLNGEIRSAFCMTEPDVASSDATNIQSRIERDGDEYVINGRKWWISGAGDPRCEVFIFMGKTDPAAPTYTQQSMIIVPRDTAGVKILRTLDVYGYDHAPHGHAEIEFTNVRVPTSNLLLGEGRGFEIAQGRLGPGRIHHCMRCIGVAERALELMCRRVSERVAFGKRLADMGAVRQDIARSRIEIDAARLLVLNAAHLMDTVGNKAARKEIAAIKVAAPQMSLEVIDRAIQAHGGMGVCQDTFLAAAWADQRTLRLADGPDAVHRAQIAKLELRQYE